MHPRLFPQTKVWKSELTQQQRANTAEALGMKIKWMMEMNESNQVNALTLIIKIHFAGDVNRHIFSNKAFDELW